MTEVKTVKEFKLTHQLSDSAFQRLVIKVCEGAGKTREQLIERQGSTEWIFIGDALDLFESAVAARKPRVSKGSELATVEKYGAIKPTEVLSNYEPDDLPILSTFKHNPTGERVNRVESRLDTLLDQSQAFQSGIFAEILKQAEQDGDLLGTIQAQATIASAERRKNAILTDYAKKQGLDNGADHT